jgi:hypothetical protein
MPRKNVDFDAHKTVKKPTQVKFTKKDGEPVKFVADKPTEVPVHVHFKANPKRSGE